MAKSLDEAPAFDAVSKSFHGGEGRSKLDAVGCQLERRKTCGVGRVISELFKLL